MKKNEILHIDHIFVLAVLVVQNENTYITIELT